MSDALDRSLASLGDAVRRADDVERAIEHRTMPGEPVASDVGAPPLPGDVAAAPSADAGQPVAPGQPVSSGGTDVAGLFRVGGPFFLIAGPCVLEDDALNLRIGEALARLSDELKLPVIYKASFDKANRSSPGSPRGPGIEEGLRRLEAVRAATGLPLLTDVHDPAQCAPAAQVADVLQIPAFLCRQTDLLTAAGATGRAVNVKKGQWMAPREMKGAAAKVRGAGSQAVAVTERGTFFGYGNLVVDMRSFTELREACEAPAVFDGTHSVQRPGEGAGVSGGDPRHIPALVRAAVAAGADGLFLETHPEPAKGLSDTTNMLPLERLRGLLDEVLAVRAAVHPGGVGARG